MSDLSRRRLLAGAAAVVVAARLPPVQSGYVLTEAAMAVLRGIHVRRRPDLEFVECELNRAPGETDAEFIEAVRRTIPNLTASARL